MGKGTTNAVAKIMTRVLILGFGVQICLGVLWACLQFPHFQEFGESLFLLKVQETLICDEYEGILYPLLLRAVLWISGVIPVPYYCILYALQLAASVWAAHFFLNSFSAIKKRGVLVRTWAILAVTTLPMAMQCHLAALPNSLTLSLFLTELGIAIRGIRARKRPEAFLTLMGLCWLAEALLLSEYRLFGGVLLTVYAIAEICRRPDPENGRESGRLVRIALVAAALLGIVSTLPKLFVTEGAYGRMGNSREAAAMRRYAWNDFGELYGYWPQELKDALTDEDITICNKYPERKLWILGEKVDGVYGREKAKEIYGIVAKAGKMVRAKRNLKEMAWDAAGYGLAPFVNLILLEGMGPAGYSAMNYETMRMRSPLLTSVYVRYGGWLFVGALLFSFVLSGIAFAGMDGKKRLCLMGWALAVLLAGGGFIFVYVTRGGGIMDYKNVLPITWLWAAWACCLAGNGMDEAKQ